jgi:hypothetical protein
MANDALADSPRQCGPFQLAEPTSAEMAYNPSIGYVRPKVSERVRRSGRAPGEDDNYPTAAFRSRQGETCAASKCLSPSGPRECDVHQ